MLKKALLVVNPIAGGNNKTSLVKQVKKYAHDNEIVLELYQTTGKNDMDKLNDYLESDNYQRILVCGGDGTIKMVARVLEGYERKSMGIFPAGSANGLAQSLNLPSDIANQIKVAMGEEIISIDALKINEQISLHLSDIGLNAEMIHKFEKSELRGYLGYTIETINTLSTSPNPFCAQLKIDDENIECDVRMIVLANAQKYGTGAVVNPVGELDDGKFEIVVIKNLQINEIFNFMTGRKEFDKENVEIFEVSEIEISCDRKVHFQIDGEYIGKTSDVHAHILSAYLNVAVEK